MLACAEAPSGEVGAGAEGDGAIRELREHHPVGRAMEGVTDLDKRVRLPAQQDDVERFFDRPAAAFCDGPRVVGRSRAGRTRGFLLGHATSNGPLYT
jgi:hypothetical protein